MAQKIVKKSSSKTSKKSVKKISKKSSKTPSKKVVPTTAVDTEVIKQTTTPETQVSKSSPVEHKPITDSGYMKVLIAIVIIFAIVAFAVPLTINYLHENEMIDQPTGETVYKYNGFVFVKQAGLWFVEIQNQYTEQVFNIPLNYGPKEVEDIIVTGEKYHFPNRDIYITFDPLDSNMAYVALAASELSQNMVRVLNKQMIASCMENKTESCADRPIITCADSADKDIIVLQQSTETYIEYSGSCVTVSGQGSELVRAADLLLYKTYGIIE